MIIFEVHYDNGWSYEDNYQHSDFFETREEAQKFYDEYKEPDNAFANDSTLTLCTLELGTQKREVICEKVLTRLYPQDLPDEAVEDDSDIFGIGKTLLGDMDDLLALREKLAGL